MKWNRNRSVGEGKLCWERAIFEFPIGTHCWRGQLNQFRRGGGPFSRAIFHFCEESVGEGRLFTLCHSVKGLKPSFGTVLTRTGVLCRRQIWILGFGFVVAWRQFCKSGWGYVARNNRPLIGRVCGEMRWDTIGELMTICAIKWENYTFYSGGTCWFD